MTSIEITSITGSIIIPYTIYACDVYGNNCVLIATIGTTVPPSNTIILPYQFNMAPAVGIKVITFDGCERFEVFNCIELPPSPTPTPTPTITQTPTPTPTPTGVMLNNYFVSQCSGSGIGVIPLPSLSDFCKDTNGNCWFPLFLTTDPPTLTYTNFYFNCDDCYYSNPLKIYNTSSSVTVNNITDDSGTSTYTPLFGTSFPVGPSQNLIGNHSSTGTNVLANITGSGVAFHIVKINGGLTSSGYFTPPYNIVVSTSSLISSDLIEIFVSDTA